MLTIHSGRAGGRGTLVRPEGDLDATTAAVFRRALGEVASAERLLIDLSRVGFMDSAGLGALVGGIRRSQENGGQVFLIGCRAGLARMLRSAQVDTIVTIADTDPLGPA